MPRVRRSGYGDGLPGTLRRSGQEAQEAFTGAYQEAVRACGEGDQAVRAAFAALKRGFEKRGDHWIARRERVAEAYLMKADPNLVRVVAPRHASYWRDLGLARYRAGRLTIGRRADHLRCR